MTTLQVVAVAALVWGMATSARALEATAATAQDKQKEEPKYEFAMKGKPWKDVFIWLNDHTNKPILGIAIPTGTLEMDVKPGKKHTIPEVVQLINAGLLKTKDEQKYQLIQRENDFVLVPKKPIER
jgi:hypothetical protein